MKQLLIIPVLLLFINSNSQNWEETVYGPASNPPLDNINGLSNAEFETLTGNENEWSKIMGVFYEFDNIELERKGFEGSIFLFDKWENKGVIVVGKKRFIVSNINFHIGQSTFMSRTDDDSTFVFSAKGIDKIYVNDKLYKNYYNSNEGNNKYYEVVYEDQKTTLLKGYHVSLVQASPNPMVNRSKNKIKRHSDYYIFSNGTMRSFKLKKSSILNLVNNEQVQKLQQYVKDYKLSYKKEKDISMMLNYLSKT